jgi:hypothetical protein
MDKHIDMDNPLCRAHWCGNFSCSDAELANAVFIMDSTVVGLVGLYLATRQSESSALNQIDSAGNRWWETGSVAKPVKGT